MVRSAPAFPHPTDWDCPKLASSRCADAHLDGLAPLLLRWVRHRHRINAELLADMAKAFWIDEAPVGHHHAQRGKPRLGKEQPRQMLGGVEPHQSTVQKSSGDRRDLRLAGLRAAAPELELEAFGHGWQRREEHVEFTTNIIPLAGENLVTGACLVMCRLSVSP